MHRALTSQQLGSGLVDKSDSDGVHADFCAASPHPKHQVGPGMDRRKPTDPHMLENAEDRKLALLVDQGVVSQDREVDLQLRTPGSR